MEQEKFDKNYTRDVFGFCIILNICPVYFSGLS